MLQICNLDKLAFEAKNQLAEGDYIPWSYGVKEAVVRKNGWTVRLVKKVIGYYLSFESGKVFVEDTTVCEDEETLNNFFAKIAEEAVEEAIEVCRLAYYNI